MDKPLNAVIPNSYGRALVRALSEVATVVCTLSASDADVIPLLWVADVLVTSRFNSAMAASAPRLRLIHTPGAGTDGIDFASVPPHVTVCNVFGHESGIAEYALMTMLALNRELFQTDRALRHGDWGDREPQRELRHRRLTIVGMGRIGSQLARYANTLGMSVIGVTRRPDTGRCAELGLLRLVGFAELESALADADFVVLAVPLSPETRDLIDARALAAMKPSAYLINVARGEVVDESALYQALKDRRIAGAAIDVWYRYPVAAEVCSPAAAPFHELDNVIMTPHVAGWTDNTAEYRASEVAANVRRLQAGEPLVNVVHAPAQDIRRSG